MTWAGDVCQRMGGMRRRISMMPTDMTEDRRDWVEESFIMLGWDISLAVPFYILSTSAIMLLLSSLGYLRGEGVRDVQRRRSKAILIPRLRDDLPVEREISNNRTQHRPSPHHRRRSPPARY